MDDYSLRQKKVFTNWINHKLDSIPGIFVNNLFEDLKDGFVLYHLLEKLEGKDLKSIKQLNKGKMRIHHINNMNIVWKFLTQTVKIVAIGPNDVVDGHPTLILGLIWSIIVFFFAKDFGGLEDMAAIKNKTLNWLKKKTEHIPDLRLHNLTTDLQDGRVFLAVLNQVNPILCPYNPTSDSRQNLQLAFDTANELYNIPKLLDARDPGCCSDEKSVLPCLAEWMRKIPEQTVNSFNDTIHAVKDHDEIVKDNLLKLGAIPSISDDKNSFQSAVDAVQLISKLLRAVQKKKDNVVTPSTHNARKSSTASDTQSQVHDMQQRHSNVDEIPLSYSGVDDIDSSLIDPSKYNLKIKVFHPDSENVDPSECRAPIVFAELGGSFDPISNSDETVSGAQTVSAFDSNKPSLLFITSYGTNDPTKDVQASLWNSEPFQPDSTDSSVTACGVACDKGSVISAIEAVKSLVSAFGNKVPVNLKVLAVSLPPSSIIPSLDESDYSNNDDGAPLHPTKKLANFIESHRDEILTPNVNVVLVSKPGSFTSQLPDSISGVFGGRGAFQFDVTVELANSNPTCAFQSFNTFLNPISVLNSVISKLLEESRCNSVLNFAPQSFESKSDETSTEQSQFQEVTEFDKFLESPEVVAHFAKLFPSFQPNQNECSVKRLFYQTTLVPTMILSSSTGNDQASARDYIPKSATCSFNVVLPVSVDVDVAYSKITSFIQNYVQEITNELVVTFSNVKKRHGWFSDPTSNLFASLTNSFKASFNTDYRPFVPSCESISSPFCVNLFQAFHGVPTYFISLNDANANIAGPNETVLLDDINGMTEALVRFTFGLTTGNPDTCSSGPSSANTKSKPVHPHQKQKQVQHKHHIEQKIEEPQAQQEVIVEQPTAKVEKQPEQIVEQPAPQFEEQTIEQQSEQGTVEQQQPEQETIEQPEQSIEQQPEQVQETVEQEPEQVQEEQQPAHVQTEEPVALETTFEEQPVSVDTGITQPPVEESVVDYIKEADDLYTELNEMRSNPAAYADKIVHLIDSFHQKDETDDKYLIFQPENGVHIQTFEGRGTLENIVEILRSLSPLPIFSRHQGMDKACTDLIEDQLTSGLTGHQGSDGSTSSDRIARHGQWFGIAGEVLVYLQSAATLRVVQLLCADGDETRHTRQSILNPEFQAVGVACGSHPNNRNMAVVTLAARYGPKALDVPALGTYNAESQTKSENFDLILQSIPVDEIHTIVQDAISSNSNIELDYTPTGIQVTVTSASGESQMLDCSWGANA